MNRFMFLAATMMLSTVPVTGHSEDRKASAQKPASKAPNEVVVPKGVIPDRIASGLVKGPIFRFAMHNLAYSPDGKRLAGGSGDGLVFLWDLQRKKRSIELYARRIRAHKDWTFSIAWTRDGRQFVTGGGDNLIHLFDLAEIDRWYKESNLRGFRLLNSVYDKKPARTFKGHSKDVHAVALTSNGKSLVSAGDDQQVIVWNLQSAAIIRRLSGHKKPITTLDISPDDSLIATGSRDRTIRLWELSTGKPLRTLSGHKGDVMAVRFSPDGKQMASAGYDKTVRIWDVESGKVLSTLKGHRGWIFSVNYSPDGTRVASAGDRSIRLWNIEKGKSVWTSKLTGKILTVKRQTLEKAAFVSFTPDGKYLSVASTAGTVTIMNVANGTIARRILAWKKQKKKKKVKKK